jgi:hypothetical protein
MSTLKTNNVQVGQSVTATNNFTLYQPATPDGTVRLGVGNSGATTADVASFTSAGVFAFNSGYGSVGVAYGCRAWVNFNGTGTPAIRASANVSSLTDNGTGDYTVNFTTAMPDNNYGVSTSVSYLNGDNNSVLLHGIKNRSAYGNAIGTTGVRVQSSDQNQNAFDPGIFLVAVFR